MADWVGIWDLDEFLVPHDKGNNILEVRSLCVCVFFSYSFFF